MVREERFILVFVDTPLEICEHRDLRGLYARARRGEIKEFTGVDDPYEAPVAPEIKLTTTDLSPEDNARKIISYLRENGFLLKDSGRVRSTCEQALKRLLRISGQAVS